jgi:hypothetical protein
MMLGTVRPVPSAFNGHFHLGKVGCGGKFLLDTGAFVPQLLQAGSDHRKIVGGMGTRHRFLIWLMGFAAWKIMVNAARACPLARNSATRLHRP